MWGSGSQLQCQPAVTFMLLSGLCGPGLRRLSPLSPEPEDRPSPQALKGGFGFAPGTRAEIDTLSGLPLRWGVHVVPWGVGGLRGVTQSSLPAVGPGLLSRPWGAPTCSLAVTQSGAVCPFMSLSSSHCRFPSLSFWCVWLAPSKVLPSYVTALGVSQESVQFSPAGKGRV